MQLNHKHNCGREVEAVFYHIQPSLLQNMLDNCTDAAHATAAADLL